MKKLPISDRPKNNEKVCTSSRKQRRQFERKLVKAKRNAWHHRQKIPTSIDMLLLNNEDKMRSRRKKKKKTKQKKEDESLEFEYDEKETKEIRRRNLMEDNEKEDASIRKLEKLLGIKPNRKTYLSGFINDGLDYLLDFCDKDKRKEIIKTEGDGSESVWEEDSLNEDQLWLKNKQKQRIEMENKKNDRISSLNPKENKKSIVKFNETIETKFIERRDSQEDEIDDDDDDEMSEEADDDDDDDEIDQESTDKSSALKEDIYGRIIDQDGNIVKTNSNGLYVPPALRQTIISSNDKSIVELKRRIQGQLNRLSEQNLFSIMNEIENLYRLQSRASVNTCLVQFYDEMLMSSFSLTNESLISEYALLISLLHGNIGLEIGSFVLEYFSEKFSVHIQDDVTNKISDNLIRFLAYLYVFYVTNSKFMFDICRYLINFDQLNEKRLELIILLLKTIGFVLRKDNPLELKQLLQQLKTISSSSKELFSSSSTRFQYLIDTIQSLKNNDIRKLPGAFEPERIDRLRKVYQRLIKDRNTKQANMLNVGLDDLLKAKEQGRWWIVGSAWSKHDSVEKISPKNNLIQEKFDEKILKLAKEQHMNTDIRKIVFATLLTSQDFNDAVEKLHKLNLTKIQEREIIHVVVHCCLHERDYNPYYSLILQQFLSYDRRFQISFQYHMWDRFKDLSLLNEQQLINLASILSHLFRSQLINLHVFKTFNFVELTVSAKNFLVQLFVQLFNDIDERSLKDLFHIPKKSNWKLLLEALKLFLSHFVLKKSNFSDLIRRRCQLALDQLEIE